jgi:hypothetical protein
VPKGNNRKAANGLSLVPFLIEVGVYAVLVTGYFFLVLHFLGGALNDLYQTRRTTYAIVALSLMIGQGVVLEMLTSALLRLFERWIHGK